MDYNKYFNELKKNLLKFSKVVFYGPLTELEIIEIEKEIGQPIKSLYREYLLCFGMSQDVFEELNTDLQSFYAGYNLIKDEAKDYLPIFSDFDVFYLLNNKDLQDNFVYKTEVNNFDKIGKIIKYKPFLQIIEESISELEKNYKSRCLNENKVNIVEYSFTDNNFRKICNSKGLKPITHWEPKYYPENIFGYEVAVFTLFDRKIIVERDEDHSNYIFEISEPISIEKEKSVFGKIEELLKFYKVDFDKMESKLIEND